MKKLIASVLAVASVSAIACPTGTVSAGKTYEAKSVCTLEGKYVSDVVLTNKYSYELKGGVFIGDDNKSNSTLSIEEGTKITGASGADFLVITRGSKIVARGSESAPIVFTTNAVDKKRGSWGGLVINGNAPINCASKTKAFCEASGEGSTGVYGGQDVNDNSGVLKYVRVEYAGYEITPENELNGIAFQGVGAGTEVDYIQVHMNADDGVEFFGGTVNVKHVVLTGNKDDSMDWTSGWTGNAQFVLVVQAADEGNNGIEADNRKSPMSAAPRSNPTLSNLTLIGSETAKKGGAGILLRKGTGARIYNTVIKGFKKGGLDIDDAETFSNGQTLDADGFPGIHITNTILDNKTNFIVEVGEQDITSWILSGMDLDLLFGSVKNLEKSLVLKNNAVDSDVEFVAPEDATGFFEEVEYVGAMDPNGQDWAAAWITK